MKTLRTGFIGAAVILLLSLFVAPSALGAVAGTASRWVGNMLSFQGSSGANGWEFLTNGLRADFGTGASDYASSDGTTVTFAGPLATASSLAATGLFRFANLNTGWLFTAGDGVQFYDNSTLVAEFDATAITFSRVLASADIRPAAGLGGLLDIGTASLFYRGVYLNRLFITASDQSADCDNAATANTTVGKLCVGAGQGSMTLTNSNITSTSLVLLTNVSDDTTCLSGYSTVGAGSAVIGCVGAATATANTVFTFLVIN